MAKLVVLTEGQNGRSIELKAERTTIGRVDDNAFQIAEQSVSSHHCEILLRGTDVVVKDLNSTNGTFINGEQISEKVLKPGQVLRLGQIELRLDNGDGSAPAATKKQAAQTRSVAKGGVKFGDSVPGSGTAAPFAKKNNKIAIVFITIGAILFAIIVIFLIWTFSSFRTQ